jgi:ABC-type sugar transport system substrate-binding protein
MPSSEQYERRSFIKKAGIVSTIGLSGLAGCSGSSGGDGTSGDGGSTGGGSNGGSGDGSSGGDESSGGDGSVQGGKALAELTTINNPYWQAWNRGFKEASAAFGFEPSTNASGGNIDKQVSDLSTAAQQGFNYVGGLAATVAGAPQFVQTAQDNELPVSTITQVGRWYHPQDIGEYHVEFHMPQMIDEGRIMARAVFEEMGGSGNFVHIEGLKGSISNRTRNAGIREVADEYSDINQLGKTLSTNWTKQQGRKKMEDLVAKFGDDIDGVIAQNDSIAAGALVVMKENDLDIPISGCDAIPIGLENVEAGDQTMTITHHVPWMGGWCAINCIDFLNGYEFSAPERMLIHQSQIVADDTSKFSDFGGKTIRAKSYNEKMYQADSTPYDWKKMARTVGDEWDPQNQITVFDRDRMRSYLDWTEENKPDGYSLPDAYGSGKVDEVQQKYEEAFKTNPAVE